MVKVEVSFLCRLEQLDHEALMTSLNGKNLDGEDSQTTPLDEQGSVEDVDGMKHGDQTGRV